MPDALVTLAHISQKNSVIRSSPVSTCNYMATTGAKILLQLVQSC